MSDRPDVLIVGAGIYGITAARALNARGHRVTVIDQGPIPHPLAASTDISKVVRMEYGADEAYTALAERAREGWLEWNDLLGGTFYHETGVLMVARTPMAPGGYEYESYRLLRSRGHHPERLSSEEIARRFPAWKTGVYVDGFYHARGGYAESGRVVAALSARARREGVVIRAETPMDGLLESGARVTGVRVAGGERISAERVVVAAGTWTPWLVPELAPFMRSVGMPVFHLRPEDPAPFTPPKFVVFGADVSRTGWYGFPIHPREGVVKVALHGEGVTLHPVEGERVVEAEDERRLRAFLADTFPALQDAPVVYTRRCLYCDTLDEHFWIDAHPGRPGLVIASGGSGHGFKFAPVLGELIADAVEGRDNPFHGKFRWRTLAPDTKGQEATRYRDGR